MAKKDGKPVSIVKKESEIPEVKALDRIKKPKILDDINSSHERNENVQKMLVENFVSLQSVMADLSLKLNNLANQISKLLELFEESAKTFMEKDLKFAGGGGDKDLADKLDKLLEQNKIIARGLALLHETNNQPTPEDTNVEYAPPPQFTQQTQQPMQNQNSNNRYQRSISSR
jgi:hypothetical protein